MIYNPMRIKLKMYMTLARYQNCLQLYGTGQAFIVISQWSSTAS